jgi:hypothetical protein
MKTGSVAVEAVATNDKSSALYQIAIIAAAVLLVVSAAFL